MTAPRRALHGPPQTPGWPGLRERVRQFLGTSWVPAAFLSGICLVAAGLWPILSPPGPAPLPSTPSPPAIGAAPLPAETAGRAAAHVGEQYAPDPVLTEGLRYVTDGDEALVEPAAGPRLTIRSVGISAPLSTVPVADGELTIPEDPARVGLWDQGARPGDDSGTVLVSGHVSWQQQRGALWTLAGVSTGDPIEVTLDGHTSHWTVTSVIALPRDADHPDLFTTQGPARLVVVTCGGPVVDGHYRDLIVVAAAPL